MCGCGAALVGRLGEQITQIKMLSKSAAAGWTFFFLSLPHPPPPLLPFPHPYAGGIAKRRGGRGEEVGCALGGSAPHPQRSPDGAGRADGDPAGTGRREPGGTVLGGEGSGGG